MPLPFPAPVEHERYLHAFFTDIHLRYPCIDEADFRTRTLELLTSDVVQASSTYLVALNYIIFACCDVLLSVTPPGNDSKPPGWNWCEMVNGLVDKESLLSGDIDLTLIQLLLFQVGSVTTKLLLYFADQSRRCTSPLPTYQDSHTTQLASRAD